MIYLKYITLLVKVVDI